MTKSEKREQAIRRTVQGVRFPDLDVLLRSYDFLPTQKGSHVTYAHPKYADQRVTIVKPHGGATTVKAVYVRNALTVIDTVVERLADEARKQQEGNE